MESWSEAALRAGPIARSLIDVVDERTSAAAEHVLALGEHLDDLYGGYGFDRVLEPSQRSRVAALVRRIRARRGPARLGQPVNSSLTMDDGRRVVAALRASPDADGELGQAADGLYRYLDELYGGPGECTELLAADERAEVARMVESLPRPATEPEWLRDADRRSDQWPPAGDDGGMSAGPAAP